MAESEQALDLLSISQTQSRCIYGAPMVAMILAGRATIGQSCCNHWECPACGIKRARQEYRRIVSGCEILGMGHKLYFWTLTCRGKECSLEEAEEHYLEWTNILLTNARTKAKRAGEHWEYAQITERQKKTRKHPHSHLITTFLPDDSVGNQDHKKRWNYTSEWFTRANLSAGLGIQHRISGVESAAAVSRYVAKYMFKETMQERWPAHWHRVRYSRGFPKLPSAIPTFVAVLRTPKEWHQTEKQAVLFVAESSFDYECAIHHIGNVLPANYLTCHQ